MIGYLALARETFDVDFAESKFSEAKNLLKSITSEALGFNQLITNDDIAKKALDFFAKNECDKIFLFQTTFTDAKFILNFAQDVKKPICIVSFPEPRTGGRLRLNSICGLNLGMHSLIKNNISPEFIIMEDDSESNKLSFSQFIESNNIGVKTAWKKAITKGVQPSFGDTADMQKIGVIGTRPEGFDTCDYDSVEVKDKLNVSLVDIDLDDLFEASRNVNNSTIASTKKRIESYLEGTQELEQDEFDKSISIYHGLDSLKEKHNLDAFAIRCWPETFTEYGLSLIHI